MVTSVKSPNKSPGSGLHIDGFEKFVGIGLAQKSLKDTLGFKDSHRVLLRGPLKGIYRGSIIGVCGLKE